MIKPNRSYQLEKTCRFSIRKFKVGVASTLIAAFYMGGMGVVAEEISSEPVQVEVTTPLVLEDVASEVSVVEPIIAEEVPVSDNVEEEVVETVSEEDVSISLDEEDIVSEEVSVETPEVDEASAEESEAEEVSDVVVKVEDSKKPVATKADKVVEQPVAFFETRQAKTTYRIQYIDVETGEAVKARNYSVSEKTPKAVEEVHTFNVTVNLDVPEGYVTLASSNAAGEELAIVDNAIAAAVVEKDSSSRSIKVFVRRDEVTSVDGDEESHSILHAAKDYTAQDIVNWAKGRLGKRSDEFAGYDLGGQCAILIQFLASQRFPEWSAYLPSGKAAEYTTLSIPSGWQRIQYSSGFIPQPGDIAIWGYNYGQGYGHVAIVTGATSSSFTVIEQIGTANGWNGTPAQYGTYSYSTPLWGVIRPNYKKTTSGSSSTSTVNRYDASKYAKEIIGNGEYAIALATNNSLKLDIEGGSKADATNVQLWNSQQTWVVNHVGNGYYSIISKQTGKSLDSTSTNLGANVNSYSYKGGKNQQWVFKPSSDGKSYEIINAHSGLVLDIKDGKLSQGTNVQMWQPNGTASQKFNLIYKGIATEASQVGRTLADGEYYISSTSSPRQRLDVTDRNKSNGTNIRIWQNTQSYQVTYLGNGYYKIINKQVGTSLTSSGNTVGANAISSAYDGSSNQKWMIKPSKDGKGYEIVNASSGLALDITGGNIVQGTNVRMWNRYNVDRQKFQFDYVMTDSDAAKIGRTLDDGDYYISSSSDPKLRLDVTDRNKQDGTNIRVWQNTQSYKLTYLGNGYYKIINNQVGTTLAVKTTDTGANVVSEAYTGSQLQQWVIKPSGDGKSYNIINRHSGLVLDIQGYTIAQGVNVHSYVLHNGANQKFQFDRVITDVDVAKIGKTLENGEYTISVASNANLKLDVANGDTTNGTAIRLWNNSQTYQLTYLGEGYYKIINKQTGTALTASTVHTGASVVSNVYTGGHQQQWAIKPTANGKSYFLINRHSGLVLDITNGSIDQGTNLQMWVSNNGGAQQFKLTPKYTVGWQQENGFWYYVDNSGNKLKNTWKDNYYLLSDGRRATNQWVKDSTGAWYYLNASGSMIANQWQGNYYLLSDGKMATNQWIKDKSGSWYYVDSKGSKVKNQWQGNYYLLSDGKMATNQWVKDTTGSWYYVNASGAFVKNQWQGDYYLQSNGKMATNKWVKDSSGTWYYVNGSGSKVKNTWIDGYFLQSDGKMATNKWLKDSSTGTWYYVNGSGSKVKNTWIDGYFLQSDGKMAVNKWVRDSSGTWYYVNSSGSKVKNTWVGDYYLQSDGRMAVNKWVRDNSGTWYYVNGSGSKVKNTWVDGYYLTSDGSWIK